MGYDLGIWPRSRVVPSITIKQNIENIFSSHLHIEETELTGTNDSVHVVQLVEFAYFEKKNTVESLGLHLPPLSHGLQHMETIDKKPSAEYYEST